jgi:HEAT repeat protein
MDEATENSLRALSDPQPAIRLQALVCIAEHRLEVPREPLHAALADPDTDVRAAAAFALSKVGGTRSLDPLHAAWMATEAGESHLRRQLLIAIGDIGGAAALAPVLHHFAEWDAELREVALGFLGVRGEADAARPLLRRLLVLPLDAKTREQVLNALGDAG